MITALTTFQQTALSALIVTNEKMVASGELEIERAVTLRWLLSQALTAFGMPAVYERVSQDNTAPDPEYDRDLAVIRKHLNREEPTHGRR